MLIPSIDLMNGRIVQLVQGEKKQLEFTDFEYWINRFAAYPVVQLIDLDAARGIGDNLQIVRQILKRLPCQVGGGIRDIARARELLGAGAKRVIVGSALFSNGAVDAEYARQLAESLGTEPLVFAVDSRGGRVAMHGWRKETGLPTRDVITTLQPFCDSFLYTHIDTEGLMGGIPMDVVRELAAATAKKLVVAGGITTHEEIAMLDAMGIDAVVGMALYTGKLRECDTPAESGTKSSIG